MRKILILAGVATMLLSSPAGAVTDAEQRGVAGPGAIVLGYLTPTITISKGDSIAFTNFDAFAHDLVHDVAEDGFGGRSNVAWCKGAGDGHEHAHAHAGPCPVFWSELVDAGGTTQVLGLQRVKPGKTYSFFCTEHHSMKGKLVVSS